MKYLFIIYCLLFATYICKADDFDSLEVKNNVIYFKDPRVDILQKIYSRKPAGPAKKMVRVQVFQATARDQVFDAKTKFSTRFPGIPTFITYSSPNFKLRAGEFATKQEAFKFLQQIKSSFPLSFVIEEKSMDDVKNDKPKTASSKPKPGTKTPAKPTKSKSTGKSN